MLAQLQQQLRDTNQADHGHDVRDYLITDHRVARAICGGPLLTASGEALLVSEDEQGLALSLYLEKDVLQRLESSKASGGFLGSHLDDLCKVIEGLSHFNYVIWRAERDRSVTLLELELQAEVDKYVSTMQLARELRETELLHELHERIFSNYRLRDDLDREQRQRYQAASDFAARFCRRLRRRLLQDGDAVLPELRRFFRMPLGDKISHIRANAWGNA